MSDKLILENEIQKALFLDEIQGQLSDGHWENSRPWEHYKDWCYLKSQDVLIATDGQTIGRNFIPVRCHYQLRSRSLLECVGYRMMRLARLVKMYGYELGMYINHNWFSIFHDDSFVEKIKPEYARAFNSNYVAIIERVANDRGLYTTRDLIIDLKAMQKAMETFANIPEVN